MKLFRAYELSFKTRRSKDEVIESLKQQARFKNDYFKFPPKILSIRRGTIIEGQVQTEGGVTLVKVKVLPSADLKAFTFIWLTSLIVFLVIFTINEFKKDSFILEFFLVLVGIFFGYAILKLVYWFSVEQQKSFIEDLVSRS
jgi:hypothetical protein